MKDNKRIASIMTLVVMSLVLLTSAATAVSYTVGGSNTTDTPSNGVNYGTPKTPSNGVNNDRTAGGVNNDVTGNDSYSNTNSMYANENVAHIGTNKITSVAPIVIYNAYEVNTTSFGQLEVQTWYGMDMSSTLPGSFVLMARVVNPSTDLYNMGVNIKFPDGRTAYAKNFIISDVNGVWQLSAEHAGIQFIGIQSEMLSAPATYIWDNRPIALPNEVKGRPFTVILMAS